MNRIQSRFTGPVVNLDIGLSELIGLIDLIELIGSNYTMITKGEHTKRTAPDLKFATFETGK